MKWPGRCARRDCGNHAVYRARTGLAMSTAVVTLSGVTTRPNADLSAGDVHAGWGRCAGTLSLYLRLSPMSNPPLQTPIVCSDGDTTCVAQPTELGLPRQNDLYHRLRGEPQVVQGGRD